MSINEDGRLGEQWARAWLKGRGCGMFQADWIARTPTGQYILVEVKHQERFLAPPFDGHGLPRWQVDARLAFAAETGIRTVLLIREKDTGTVFWQWLDELEAGKKFQTNGAKPRRVYPLEAFRQDVVA